ncbi:MAG: energy transducer TonB [Pseudomonadota bacterium]
MFLEVLAAASVSAAPLALSDALWKVRPTGDDLMLAYPEAPRLQRVAGRAEIECAISVKGALEACQVISETPAGLGFGDAALNLSRKIVLHPQDRTGANTAGRAIRVPVRWVAPPAPPEGRQVDPANIVMVKKATGEDVARYYPERAQRENVEGRASVLCRITQEFTLTACAVTEDEPQGYGFGIAVQFVAQRFQVSPTGKDGSAIRPGDIFPLRIRFVLPR